MKSRLLTLAAFLSLGFTAARAHQLDEYVQTTFIAVEPGQLRVDLFLTPGLNVLPAVLAAIDTDRDGSFSPAEQRAYSTRVLHDLSFSLDGTDLPAELKGFTFPTSEDLRDSRGDIHLELVVPLPITASPQARLSFNNHHQRPIAAYQVNALVPRDPAIRLGAQERDPVQSTWAVTVTLPPPR